MSAVGVATDRPTPNPLFSICCTQIGNCPPPSQYSPDFDSDITGSIGGPISYQVDKTGECVKVYCYKKSGSQQIACGQTKPSDCAGVPCSGSPETIGDLVPAGSKGYVSVVDINGIWDGDGQPIGGSVIGWIYEMSNGSRLIQANFANRAVWGGSLSIPFLGMFGISVAGAGGYGALKPYNGLLSPGSSPLKCESGGGTYLG